MPDSEHTIPIEAWELAASDAATPAELDAHDPAWIPATVPGTVAEALLAAGTELAALPDLDDRTWWYRGHFRCAGARGAGAARLQAEGLATVAEVWIDGERVATSSSMFVPLATVVGPLPAEGRIHIRFARLRGREWPRRPRARWHGSIAEHRDLRWARTTLLGRTPGFSPPIRPVGPTAGVELMPVAQHAWQDIDLRTRLIGETGEITTTAFLSTPERPVVELTLDGRGSWRATVEAAGESRWWAQVTARLPDVVPWWPATHGAPVLHELALEAGWPGGELPVVRRRVGFRRIAVAEEAEFGFTVNDMPIFCRGACWTPLDLTRLREDAAELGAALREIARAGMNMIRLTGGTLYASEALLDACDELGILIWQDFMFGSLDYPFADEEFRAAALAEARHAVRRARGHACLALLCGSSEHEQRMAMLGGPVDDARETFFTGALGEVCRTLAPEVRYLPSSPTGGVTPFSPDAGCTHYYGVGAYGRPIADARESGVRFASECLAFANVPDGPARERALGPTRSPAGPTWKAGSPRDIGAGWDFDDVRDGYFEDVFDADPRTLRAQDPDRYLELSALVSGEVMARTFALWRDRRSASRGGLVWFLRDLGPGAGWGLIDSTGRPKPAFELLAPSLQPVAIFLLDDGLRGLTLVAVNDTAVAIRARVRLRVGTFGGVVQQDAEVVLDVPARGGREWPLTLLMNGFRDLNYAYRFGPLGHDVVHARAETGGDVLEAWYFPAPLPARRDDTLRLTARLHADGSCGELELTTNRFAQYVSVFRGEARIARLHVAPWQPARIPVEDRSRPITASALNADAVVRADWAAGTTTDATTHEPIPAIPGGAPKGP